ncbi:MAG: hypothetical protein LKK47_03625 [Bifidobacterium thermacidophilum]|jgi:hypothetical protein|nr:hypothetical protein [Bifidobacterium thermacidophilum]
MLGHSPYLLSNRFSLSAIENRTHGTGCVPTTSKLRKNPGVIDTLTYSHGLISRKNDNIDLRRLKSISAEDSPFTGGKLTLIETNAVARTLPYVKDARTIADSLRHLVDEASLA